VKQRSDRELVELMKGNSRNHAFAEIYRRYASLSYGVCLKYLGNRHDSLDAVTDIFESLLSSLPHYQIDNLAAWLYKLTTNHCLMKLRSMKRRSQHLYLAASETPKNENPTETEDIKERNAIIQDAVNKLGGLQQQCIQLFYFQQKTYAEISAETGLSVKTVKSHLQNGRIKLKKIIKP